MKRWNRRHGAGRLGAMLLAVAACVANVHPALGAEPAAALRERALDALHRAVAYFRTEVAVQGTYLWAYNEDLSLREGEGAATTSQGWVQPPGTPSVGQAYLNAFEATGDRTFLEAARETALGLTRGQLESGGWSYYIDFDPNSAKPLAYRAGAKPRARNITTLDDNTTQAALRFMMRVDQALDFKERAIHEAVGYALERLLRAQYPNGAWPQGFNQAPSPADHPVLEASIPEHWSRTWPGSQNYWFRYTLNDGVLADVVEALLDAAEIYAHVDPPGVKGAVDRCLAAVSRAGDFLLLAQLPEPQPAWAQQYDEAMHPAWARKFEPPSITASESQGAIRTLFRIYRATGKSKYLEPVPGALAYLRRCRLEDGRLARFYELGSNRPLYFTKDYQLTYEDDDLPTHYAFKGTDGTAALEREYLRLKAMPAEALGPVNDASRPERRSPRLEEVRRLIDALDDHGRWLEEGRLRHTRPEDQAVRVIRSATFVRHLETLCDYLRSSRP